MLFTINGLTENQIIRRNDGVLQFVSMNYQAQYKKALKEKFMQLSL
jgi:hypothetical protein